jgi:hypothetical protein
MKIIFLDFDGVMNPKGTCIVGNPGNPAKTKFGEKAVKNLNYILEQTGAYIVVSSAWRGDIEFLKDILDNNGVIPGRCLSQTPRISEAIRGIEVKRWLIDWIWRGNEEPENFVIIDDGNNMGDLLPYLVQTKYTEALTRENAEKAIKILKEVK